jgi:hypothetical protein
LTDFSKIFNWAVRILPFSIIAGLLIPGDAWIAQEIRTFAGLITVLILPGFALARLLRLFDHFDNWLDALSLSVALSWGSGLVLWLLFFFLSVPLQIVSFIWLGVTLVGLIVSIFVSLPRDLLSPPSRPWFVVGIVVWIVVVTAATYLYGGRVDSDAYSYMTWLRNISVGDIRPGVNIHASWEVDYPFYKNLYAPTLLYYAMSGFLARVDVNWVWTHAPAMWVPVMLAVYFSLAYYVFKHKSVGYVTLLIVPLVDRGLFAPSLGGSHAICNSIFLPLAWWLYLRTVFAKGRAFVWMFPLCVLIAVGLAFEHIPHIIHFLLVVGTFTVFQLLSRRRDVTWHSIIVIVVVLLLVAPFIWQTWRLATAYQLDAGKITAIKLQRGKDFIGGDKFFIVRPQRLFRPTAALGAFLVVLYLRYLWQHEETRIVLAGLTIAVFIGFNPLLTPFLSRAIAPHVTFRLGEALIILPIIAYGIVRAVLRARALWHHRRQIAIVPAILLLAVVVLFGKHQLDRGISAANDKIKGIVYSPAGVSTNLSDRLIRRAISEEIESPPYPIFDPPARLTRYLDAATLSYIRESVPSDSVFLAERLTEYNLPAYVDQLAYLGRPGWPEWGNVCPRVRAEGAKDAFPLLGRPEVVYKRLDVSCTVLDPDADLRDVEQALRTNGSEIDYILVTPNTSYLEAQLDRIMPQARVYSRDGFIIYALRDL